MTLTKYKLAKITAVALVVLFFLTTLPACSASGFGLDLSTPSDPDTATTEPQPDAGSDLDAPTALPPDSGHLDALGPDVSTDVLPGDSAPIEVSWGDSGTGPDALADVSPETPADTKTCALKSLGEDCYKSSPESCCSGKCASTTECCGIGKCVP